MKVNSQNGFSLIEMLVVVIIIGIIAAIAIPALISSRKAAKESAAIANLRTIHSAQAVYWAAGGNSYGTFSQLSTSGQLDSSFTGASVTRQGYTIALSVTGTANGYCAKSSPATTSDGTKYFGVNQSGTIYKSTASADIACATGVLTTSGGAAVIGN